MCERRSMIVKNTDSFGLNETAVLTGLFLRGRARISCYSLTPDISRMRRDAYPYCLWIRAGWACCTPVEYPVTTRAKQEIETCFWELKGQVTQKWGRGNDEFNFVPNLYDWCGAQKKKLWKNVLRKVLFWMPSAFLVQLQFICQVFLLLSFLDFESSLWTVVQKIIIFFLGELFLYRNDPDLKLISTHPPVWVKFDSSLS